MGLDAIRDRLGRKKKSFQENPKDSIKQHWGVLTASTIFLIALYLRYMPAQSMQYFQALDPYWIFRQSQHLALEGNIPAVDFMRYFPYNAPFYKFNNGDIVIPALMYWMGPFLVFESYLSWAQFYPAFMGALGVLMTYFLGKEIYDKYVGVSAAFFLATIPGVLQRTSAGFFEKEPIGSFFMVVSLYFFTRAWKRNKRYSGIISGLALGLFTISWGGSKFLWLLYPLVVGIMMLLNEDIRKMVAAYTPTVIVAGGVAAALNPARFWITGSIFLGNIALLMFLWSRYLVDELDILEENQIPYYTPGASIAGGLLLLLSPLYSDFIATRLMNLINTVSRDGGGVIAGTVAENTAASLSQLVGQLGAGTSARVGSVLPEMLSPLAPLSSVLGAISNLVGAWQLAFIGVIFSGTYIAAMILRKFDIVDETISSKTYHSLLTVFLFAWTLVFAMFFQDSILVAVGPSVLVLIGGIGIVRGLDEDREVSIGFEWYKILPFVWAAVSILGAVTMARLIFLAAFPTAFMAGYAFSKAWRRLKEMSSESVTKIGIGSAVLVVELVLALLLGAITGLTIAIAVVMALNGIIYYAMEEFEELEFMKKAADIDLKRTVIVAVLVLTVLANLSAGLVNANFVGGSPNNLWAENLEYMEEETPEGSVILSWWDYGYWFESIGRRAAIADGGNSNYYTNGEKINMPLADFLTSSNPANHTDFLEKHSVDYIVLDETMIGKYSAVSQISNRDNSEFSSMLQISTRRNIQNSLSRDSKNNTVVNFQRGRIGLYLPIDISGGEVSIREDTAPTIEAGRRGKVDCVLTPEGRQTYDVDAMKMPGRIFGSESGSEEICVAINPYYNMERAMASVESGNPRRAQAVLVPKDISRSTLVRLYLMDGHGMDMVEKVDEGSPFGFVKMWKVNIQEN